MNVYAQMSNQLVSELTTGLATLGYAPLLVQKGVWKPRALPEFERYLVHIAPPLNGAWTERRISTKEVAYVLRADIFLLVKNFSEELSVYGQTAPPDLGLFQLISDVKDLLRATNLNGLLSRTYDETMGDIGVESGAAQGFDTGPRSWVHRARVPYTATTEPFCFPPS